MSNALAEKTQAEHREFAEAVEELARAAGKVSALWTTLDLPGGHAPEDGFPFSVSLDEAEVQLWDWADREWKALAERQEGWA